jgi:hypothetical protein
MNCRDYRLRRRLYAVHDSREPGILNGLAKLGDIRAGYERASFADNQQRLRRVPFGFVQGVHNPLPNRQ